MKQAELWK